MRVLITGMGGELGTRITNLLEADPDITEICGIDGYPPRRRITRVRFHRVDPDDRRRITHLVTEFDPEVIVHFGVYEPHAHFGDPAARMGTLAAAVSTLGAAHRCPSLRRIVVRSGIEVYGRHRNAPLRPDERIPTDPTNDWGRSLVRVEELATEAAERSGADLSILRFAPILGPSFPSPLGRYLRLPVVGVAPFAELPLSLIHQEDAAEATVVAIRSAVTGPLNIVGPGAVTASQAVRRGRRIPWAVFGPGWQLAAAAAEVLGAPLPPHVRDLLVRGAGADGSRAVAELGIEPRPTPDVVDQLYRWEATDVITESVESKVRP